MSNNQELAANAATRIEDDRGTVGRRPVGGNVRHQWASGLLVLAIMLSALPSARAQAQTGDAPSIVVMSFNLRFGSANDGDNRWENRTELVRKAVEKNAPDLLGTQETLPFQAEFLSESFPEYQRIGRSREPENPNGEQCTLYFRPDRFDLLASGHFWLSETPDQPGSRSWDSSLPRMATWARLWDRKTRKPILMVNTHFDHRGEVAREKSAALLRERTAQLAQGASVVITGDFNCGTDSPPHQQLVNHPQGEVTLQDTYLTLHQESESPAGTFNGFQGRRDGARIDWVVVSEDWKVVRSEIEDYQENNRYPSDHFPVVAEIKVR